jgi:hypothetical protein
MDRTSAQPQVNLSLWRSKFFEIPASGLELDNWGVGRGVGQPYCIIKSIVTDLGFELISRIFLYCAQTEIGQTISDLTGVKVCGLWRNNLQNSRYLNKRLEWVEDDSWLLHCNKGTWLASNKMRLQIVFLIILFLYRPHTAILNRPLSSAAMMEVQGPDTT